MLKEKEEKSLEPLTYSNEVKPTIPGFLFAALFGFSAIGLIILSIYLGSIDGDWWVLAFFLPISIILGWFASFGLPIQKRVVYSYELRDDGIHQQWRNTKTGETNKNLISFNQVHQVIIGINPVRLRLRHRYPYLYYYRFDAIIIVLHEEHMFIETLWKAEDLTKWKNRLEGKVPITYTEHDLSQALQAAGYTDIDFSQVNGSSTDTVTSHVGQENTTNPFPTWLPDGTKEAVDQKKQEKSRSHTKKAESRSRWILFFYAIVSAAVLLPNAPLDADGFVEITDAILIWYIGVNLLIPLFLVFFRRHAKWYNPFFYTVVVAAGNCFGLLLVSFFIDTPSLYSSIFILNFFNIILWSVAMIGAKVVRVVFVKD